MQIALLGLVVVSLAGWAALAARVVLDPSNHVGVEPLWAIALFATLLVLAWLPWRRSRPWVGITITAYAMLSIVALLAIDRGNILVEYHRWIRRGMPERPCGPVLERVWSCHR